MNDDDTASEEQHRESAPPGPSPLDVPRKRTENPTAKHDPAQAKNDMFTPEQQAEVDRIVHDRIQRVEAKYEGIDVEASEQRLSELGQQIRDGELRLLRNHMAERIGLSPEDRDLLLSGTDINSLETQAARLVQRGFGRPLGNVARREGQAVAGPTRGNEELRDFVNNLFGNDDW